VVAEGDRMGVGMNDPTPTSLRSVDPPLSGEG